MLALPFFVSNYKFCMFYSFFHCTFFAPISLSICDSPIQWRIQEFFLRGGRGVYTRIFFREGVSTNSVEDRGQRKWGSEG
jgi:hypothetical protein